MKEYFRYFRWLYLALGVVILLYGIIGAFQWVRTKSLNYERTNTECTTTERVFDYADVLTDRQEEKLRKLIAKREKQTGCDIVLITLNETLKEYAREIEPDVDYDEFVRVFAEQFYEDNCFGYDRANGDGVLLIDNWYREDDGKIYTWLCTTGKAYDAYYVEDIDHLLDEVYRYVENNPYKAYKTYVEEFYRHMTGKGRFAIPVPGFAAPVIGLIAAVIFIAVNWQSRKGRKTVTATTYVAGKQPIFRAHEDRFLRKNVVRHKIQTSSGGGGSHGGGGGRSHGGGGGSHGGGGHSR